MVYFAVYVVLPILVTLGLIRTLREIKWGKCKSKTVLKGRVFIVTGANSGLGKETAKQLAIRKATVILACRDVNSARQAIEDIRRTVTSGELIPIHLDLASLESVRTFANQIIKDFPQVHVLINNAGVAIPVDEKRKTNDGFEIHFGVNHLGHFLLTNLLLPKLKESVPSRIVIVSSTLHTRGNIEFDDLNGEKLKSASSRFNPGYSNSKLANFYFCTELAKKIEGTGVTTYCLCPGMVYTGLFRYSHLKWYHYLLLSPVAFYFMRTVSKGAQTILHCATSEELAEESGKFYRDCKIYECPKILDPATAKKLWEVSEQLVGLKAAE